MRDYIKVKLLRKVGKTLNIGQTLELKSSQGEILTEYKVTNLESIDGGIEAKAERTKINRPDNQ